MDSYTEQELDALNGFTLALFSTASLGATVDAVLELAPTIIRHQRSLFYVLPSSFRKRPLLRSRTIPQEHLDSYEQVYEKVDYLNWFLNQTECVAQRSSDLVEREVMTSSKVYREWLAPMGVDYVCTVPVVSVDGRHFADLSLMRALGEPDFDDHELHLLTLMARQIALHFSMRTPVASGKPDAAHDILERLTPREREVALLACSDTDTRDIASQLSISYGTARKHMASIYGKLGVSSRLQLMNLLRGGISL